MAGTELISNNKARSHMAEELVIASKQIRKFSEQEYEDLYYYYKELVEELEKKKRFL